MTGENDVDELTDSILMPSAVTELGGDSELACGVLGLRHIK